MRIGKSELDFAAKQGFSLIELMVVVAVMGIILVASGPALSNFIAKSKQSEAKLNLSELYLAQQAFYSDYGHFHGSLPYVGYIPNGFPKRADGCPNFAANTAGASAVPRAYWIGGSTPPAGNRFSVDAAVAGLPAPDVMCAGANTTNYSTPLTPFPGSFSAGVLDQTFLLDARGRIADGTLFDVWTVDENKSLSNIRRGY